MTARLASTDDNALLASIVMHPDVRKSSGCTAFDPSNYTNHPTNFAVVVDGGCFEAMALERGSYAVHTNFLPDARGAHALRQSRDALRLAFTRTDAESLYTKVQANNPQAATFAVLMGFKRTYECGGATFYRLDIDDWVLNDPTNMQAGAEFHDWLGEGVTHEQDAVHDAYVGAACLMVRAIQFEKAERIYGRWARHAGYQPFAFISADPVRLDIGSHVLRLDGTEFNIEEKEHA